MTFEAFARAFVACFFVFVALHYTARLSGLRARRGFVHAPIGAALSANGFHQIIFRVFRAAILMLMIARVFSDAVEGALVPIAALERPPVTALGLATLCAALLLIDYAHSYLNDEWRSGVAARPADLLVEGGPYAFSRNPIFFGVLLGQVGLFLAAPSLFTLLCLAVGWAVILRQVRVEERTLAIRFGDRWSAYASRVPRWLPIERFARRTVATR